MAKYDIFAPFHFGFTEFQIQNETLRKISETLHTNETAESGSKKVILHRRDAKVMHLGRSIVQEPVL